MPTISQLPSAAGISAGDLFPVSQSGTTRYVSASLLAAYAGSSSLGFTPINKAGDTGVGPLTLSGLLTANNGGAFTGTFSGDHSYSGTLTLSKAGTALSVTNNATVGGTLGITGATTMAALTASGAVSLSASGTALAVTNNATVGGTLGITGATTMAALTASGAVSLTAAGTALDVTNNTRVQGTVQVGSGAKSTVTITPGANTSTAATIQPNGTGGIKFNGSGPLRAANLWPGDGGTYTWSGSTFNDMFLPASIRNATAGTCSYANITTSLSIVNNSVNLNAPTSLVSALSTTMLTGGAVAAASGWQALYVSLGDGSAATNDFAAGTTAPFVAAQINRIANKNQGGTALDTVNSFGQHWGIDVINDLKSGATYAALQNGVEINMAVETGASVVRRAGIQISSAVNHQVRGAMWDYGISGLISSGAATLREWMTVGGGLSGTSPLGTDSSFLAFRLSQDRTCTADSGLDMNDATLTSFFLRSNGFQVGNGGTTRIGTGYVTPTTSGLEVDVKGSVGTIATGAGSINAGGSGFNASSNFIAEDAQGGVYAIATDGTGAASSVAAVYRQPTYNTTSPPATLAVTPRVPYNTGSGIVLNATWATSRTILSLNPAGGSVQTGSGTWTANGSVATAMSSIGPTGAHTTVQEWFTVKNASGTVRYIPAF